MIKILHVEDKIALFNHFKEEIEEMLDNESIETVVKIENAASMDSGEKAYSNDTYDMILFDIKIPEVDNGPEKDSGGLLLLELLSKTSKWISNPPTYFLHSAFKDSLSNAQSMGIGSSLVNESIIFDKQSPEETDRLQELIIDFVKDTSNTEKYINESKYKKILNLYENNGYKVVTNDFIKLSLKSNDSTLEEYGRLYKSTLEKTIKMIAKKIIIIDEKDKYGIYNFNIRTKKYREHPNIPGYIEYLNKTNSISIVETSHMRSSYWSVEDYLQSSWKTSNNLQHLDPDDDNGETKIELSNEELNSFDDSLVKTILFSSLVLFLERIIKSVETESFTKEEAPANENSPEPDNNPE